MESWAAACQGQSSLVSVSGEPGIGKTTLVDDFLCDVARGSKGSLIGRGRCSETLAATEAYLPIVEALETLVRSGGVSVDRTLKQLAPTWHLQVAPAAWTDSSADRLRHEIRSGSQQRLKREIRAFLQEISRQSPILLFLDDVHWADPATVDLLAYLARSFDGMRLLVVTTHRVAELLLAGNPLAPLLLDLQARGTAQAVPLPFLDRGDVERYLELEFAGHAFPQAFAALVHAKTEGSPLFMVDMLADLRDRGVIRQEPQWRLIDDVPAIERQLPASIRSMIQRRLDHLTDDDLRLLRVASIQGQHFDSVPVAEAAELGVVDVEERLELLQRVHGLVRLVEEREFPDRVSTARYQFVHVLHQNVLHASLTPARRAALSAAVARSLQAHHAAQWGPVAARIAVLFEAAREYGPAAAAYAAAAEHAAHLVAHREAAALARRGLAALERLSAPEQREGLELRLLVTLGVAVQVTQGYTSAEARRTYVRARELCLTTGNRSELFAALWGLWMYAVNTADYTTALGLADELIAMASNGRPRDRVRAAWARGATSLHLGDPATALRYFEQGLACYSEEDDRVDRHLYGHDAGITCRSFGAWALFLLGEEDRAIREADLACDIASSLAHPQSHTFALSLAGNLHRDRGEPALTLARAAEAVAISEREGFPQFREWNRAHIGWATARLGRVEEGLTIATEALETLDRLGSALGRPYFSAVKAEIVIGHRPAEALELLEDAIEEALTSRELQYHPELLRLKAQAVAALGNVDAAQRVLDEAAAVARAQGAVGLVRRVEGTRAALN
jgi:tetratricopeptide (TPR) repeat protein